MALVKCPECGKEVSDSAANCLNCGYGIKLHYEKIELEKQQAMQKEKMDRFKEKLSSSLKNKKVAVLLIIVMAVFLLGLVIYRTNHSGVIHGVKWDMSLAQIEKQEIKYSGFEGTYDAENNYYAISNVDFYDANVSLMYIFEEDKLSTIWIQPSDVSYENVYKIAENICEREGLPVEFEDNTEDVVPSSRLRWNIKGSTIELIGNYEKYKPSYYFCMKPYNGHDYGKSYTPSKMCQYGSKSYAPCENYVIPWYENIGIWPEPRELCYEHGCRVIGCPNGFANISDKETLCMIHHFLIE